MPNGKTKTNADGAIERSETIELNVAAVVTNVLPNGNLMITGSQEVRVNFEMRVLTIAGIVRPADIGPQNTIAYDRIAEARISYGGRGTVSDVQLSNGAVLVTVNGNQVEAGKLIRIGGASAGTGTGTGTGTGSSDSGA